MLGACPGDFGLIRPKEIFASFIRICAQAWCVPNQDTLNYLCQQRITVKIMWSQRTLISNIRSQIFNYYQAKLVRFQSSHRRHQTYPISAFLSLHQHITPCGGYKE